MSEEQPLDDLAHPKKKPNNRRTILVIAVIALFACAACGIISLFMPSDSESTVSERSATIEAVEAAEEPAEAVAVATEPAESDADEVEPTEPPPTDVPAPTSTPEPTATPEPQPDMTIYVTGFNISPDDIPQGQEGLSVVLAGPPSQFGVVPVVVRNNTDAAVYDIDFSASARDTAGAIVGTGSGDDVVPSYVPPGGLAIGRLLFGDTPLDGATIEYVLTSRGEPGLIFARRDLEIVEHNLVGGTVVGLSRNNHSSALDLTKVVVMCFDDDSIPTTVRFNYTDQDRVEAGADLPFSVDLLGEEDQCGRYLIAGSGRETN